MTRNYSHSRIATSHKQTTFRRNAPPDARIIAKTRSTNKKRVALAACFILAFVLPTLSQAQERNKLESIQIAPGHSSVRLAGSLVLSCGAEARDCPSIKKGYLLRVLAGQTITIKLEPENGDVVINDILDPHQQSIIPPDAGKDFWYGWKVEPTEKGEYRIYVSTAEKAKRVNTYTLRVSIHTLTDVMLTPANPVDRQPSFSCF